MKQVKSILTRNRFFETIFEFWKLDEFELMFGFEHFWRTRGELCIFKNLEVRIFH